jgi:hypothetical protein
MIATNTITVKITENDEDSGLGLILYVSKLVGVSGVSLTKTSIANLLKKQSDIFSGWSKFQTG